MDRRAGRVALSALAVAAAIVGLATCDPNGPPPALTAPASSSVVVNAPGPGSPGRG